MRSLNLAFSLIIIFTFFSCISDDLPIRPDRIIKPEILSPCDQSMGFKIDLEDNVYNVNETGWHQLAVFPWEFSPSNPFFYAYGNVEERRIYIVSEVFEITHGTMNNLTSYTWSFVPGPEPYFTSPDVPADYFNSGFFRFDLDFHFADGAIDCGLSYYNQLHGEDGLYYTSPWIALTGLVSYHYPISNPFLNYEMDRENNSLKVSSEFYQFQNATSDLNCTVSGIGTQEVVFSDYQDFPKMWAEIQNINFLLQ